MSGFASEESGGAAFDEQTAHRALLLLESTYYALLTALLTINMHHLLHCWQFSVLFTALLTLLFIIYSIVENILHYVTHCWHYLRVIKIILHYISFKRNYYVLFNALVEISSFSLLFTHYFMYYLPHYDVFDLLCFVMNRLDGSIRDFLPPQDPGRPKSTGAHKTTRKPG